MAAAYSYPGDVARCDGAREVVRPACGASAVQGFCVTCGEFLPTIWYVELHMERPGVHVIARICPLHGLEATAE